MFSTIQKEPKGVSEPRGFSPESKGFSPWIVRVLAPMLLLAVAPAAAVAQPPADPREVAAMRFGPLYMTPTVQLRGFGIDTNVFNEFENPKSDFTYTFGPALDLWVPFTRRFLLTTRTDLSITYFQKYADQRSIDPRSFARADVILNRLNLFAENDFLWSKERANLEIDDRVRQRVNAARAGFSYAVTPKFLAEVSLHNTDFDFEADFTSFRAINYRAGLQRNERGLRIGLRHRLTSKTTLVLDGETQRIRFDFAGLKNADGFRITPGVNFTPRALIGGTARIGFRRFSPLNQGVPDFQGLVASMSLGYTFLGATRLTLETSRDLAYSYEVSRPYYVTTGFGGNIRRQVRGDIDLVLAARRTRQNYRVLAEAPVAPRSDLILNYSADLGYRVNRSARLGFVVAWQRRESSDGALRAYEGVRAGLSLSYGGIN